MSARTGLGRELIGSTYLLPAIIAAVSAGGLVFALVGDGAWDAASWLGLGIPVAIVLWCWQSPVLSSSRSKDVSRAAVQHGD